MVNYASSIFLMDSHCENFKKKLIRNHYILFNLEWLIDWEGVELNCRLTIMDVMSCLWLWRPTWDVTGSIQIWICRFSKNYINMVLLSEIDQLWLESILIKKLQWTSKLELFSNSLKQLNIGYFFNIWENLFIILVLDNDRSSNFSINITNCN